MFRSSWIRTTKQMWKLYIFVVAMLLALVSLYEAFKYDEPQLMIVFLFLSITATLWFIFSIKCPFCKYKIVKHQFFKEKYEFEWFEGILYRKSCPSCGRVFPED